MLKQKLLTTTFIVSLASFPMLAHAQNIILDSETQKRNEARIDGAVAYTKVLYNPHWKVKQALSLRKHRVLDETALRARHDTVLNSIRSSETVPSGSIQGLNEAILPDWDVKFRHCDDVLLTYMDTTNFKQNLSVDEIQIAPITQALRHGRDVAHQRIPGKTVSDGAGGVIVERLDGSHKQLPSCMTDGVGYPSIVPIGVLAFADKSLSRFTTASITLTRETREEVCAANEVGKGRREERFLSTPKNAYGQVVGTPYYDTSEADSSGHWKLVNTTCRAPRTQWRYGLVECDRVINGLPLKGHAQFRYWKTEAQDPSDATQKIWLPSDEDGNYLPAPVGVLVSSNCDQDPNDQIARTETNQTEQRTLACTAVYPTHPNGNYSQSRVKKTVSYVYPFTNPDLELPPLVVNNFTDWITTQDTCFKVADRSTTETQNAGCPSGWSGAHTQTRTTTDQWAEYANTTDNTDAVINAGSTTPWTTVSNTCTSNSGGGNGGGGDDRSFDVDGDGVGDFSNSAQAADAGYDSGQTVSGGCQGCNGLSGGDTGSGGGGGGNGGGGNKIVCTAMNARYGFGSFRQAIWLKHAQENLTTYHQTGYHILFLPLVGYAYGGERIGARPLRKALEHIARERTADIWAEKRGTERRKLGRTYRMVLEPIMYGVGRLAKGKEVAGIKDVPTLVKHTISKG